MIVVIAEAGLAIAQAPSVPSSRPVRPNTTLEILKHLVFPADWLGGRRVVVPG